MKLLALDTTAEGCSVALNLDGRIEQRYQQAPRQHTRLLIPMIRQLLADAGLSLSDLDGIAFGRGPGSFTGLRIAAGVVQGLAFGLDRPVVPVSSLAAVALAGARERNHTGPVAAAFDARMQEVYWGCFDVDPSAGRVDSLMAEAVLPPTQVTLPDSGPQNWLGAGDGWQFRADMPESVRQAVHIIQMQIDVQAGDIARLAGPLWEQGAAVSAYQAVPVYLRDEVAWQKAPGRA